MDDGDETGAAAMALDELAADERAVEGIHPSALWVLSPRFERIRAMIDALNALVVGYLADESRRIDELGQEEDLSADAKLRADLAAHHARVAEEAEAGQGTLLVDPVKHRDL